MVILDHNWFISFNTVMLSATFYWVYHFRWKLEVENCDLDQIYEQKGSQLPPYWSIMRSNIISNSSFNTSPSTVQGIHNVRKVSRIYSSLGEGKPSSWRKCPQLSSSSFYFQYGNCKQKAIFRMKMQTKLKEKGFRHRQSKFQRLLKEEQEQDKVFGNRLQSPRTLDVTLFPGLKGTEKTNFPPLSYVRDHTEITVKGGKF